MMENIKFMKEMENLKESAWRIVVMDFIIMTI